MKGKSLLLFDVDGTLVDTMPAFSDIAYELLKTNPLIAPDTIRTAYYKTSGQPFFKQLKFMIPAETPQQREKLSKEFERRKANVLAGIRLTTETVATLRHLQAKGYMLCVSGSGRQSALDSLFSPYADLFAFILGFRPPHFHKGTAHISYILQATQKKRDELVYIGDSLNDALMAQQNGISFIAKVGSFIKKDFHLLSPTIPTIARLEELETIFDTVPNATVSRSTILHYEERQLQLTNPDKHNTEQ